MHMSTLMSIVLLLALPCAASAQVYSWKDASGKVHYGDQPPAERSAQSRKLPGAPAMTDDVEAARKASAERQFSERDKQAKAGQETGKPSETPAQAKDREANCRQSRANLAALESGQIRFSHNAKGERIALDGAVREVELAKARKSVELLVSVAGNQIITLPPFP